jgi:aminopeptidase N
MKKITFLFSFFISAFVFAQTEEEAYEKLINAEQKAAFKNMQVQVNPNTANYDITYHELRFTVNPATTTGFISGVVKTTFTALSNMNTVTFDLATQLTVSNVKRGTTNLTFNQANNELVINLPATLTTGNSTTVEITYSGNPPTAEQAFTRGTHGGTPIIYTLSEPFGARDWWPCKQDLNDKINSVDIYITAPSSNVSVSNGVKQSRIVNGANATTHFRHNYPIPAYLISINVTNYQEYTSQLGLGTPQSPFIPFINYLYPESNTTTNQNNINQTNAIFDLFETLFGPYPFRNEHYGHVQFGFGGGMEHTTMSSMGSFGRSLIAHELGHQWFGDKITCGSWRDIWLNEGLTEYTAGLTVEGLDGAASFVSWKNSKINNITSSNSGALYLTETEAQSVSRIFSSRLSYNKGAMVSHMLRWKMGDAMFFQALRNYLNDPALAYGYAVTSNLKAHLEAVYGSSLTEFFNDWVYGQGYPTYSVSAQNFGTGQAKITVNQTTNFPSGASNGVDFFEMPLEIRLTSASGQTHDVVVENTTTNQNFIVNVPFVVTGVEFDPNKHIISRNSTAILSNDTFSLEKAIALYPNPANDYMYVQLPEDVNVEKVEIYNYLGQLIFVEQGKELNTQNLKTGMHIAKIITNEGSFFKNFLKK